MRVMATRVAVRFITSSPGRDWSGLIREPIAGIAPSVSATALTRDINVRRDHLAIAPEDVFAAAAQLLRKCTLTNTWQCYSIGLENAKGLALNLSAERA